MPYLDNLAASDPELRARLHDLGVSGRALARELGVDEKSIRRYRRRTLQSPHSVSSPQPKYKNGVAQWVPGIDMGQDDGEVRTIPRYVGDGVDEPEDADLMRELGVNPELWEVIARRESRWQQGEGREFLRAYRISVRRRSRTTGDLSVDAMNEILSRYQTPGKPKTPGGSSGPASTFVIALGDTQVGKSFEKNGGTPELIERFGEVIEQARQRMEAEGPVTRAALFVLGDCIEGVTSQNGRLITRQDVSVTEQVRIYRRMLLHAVATLAPWCDELWIVPVGGNHDQPHRIAAQTKEGTDSWSIEGASAVEDALRLAGDKYAHVTFVFPPDDDSLVTTIQVGTERRPFKIAATHGHLAGSQTKSVIWWSQQGFGRQPGGDADILLAGHFHSLKVMAVGGKRLFVQVPAMDGGSAWWTKKTGDDPDSGIVTFWTTPGSAPGWTGLVVHSTGR